MHRSEFALSPLETKSAWNSVRRGVLFYGFYTVRLSRHPLHFIVFDRGVGTEYGSILLALGPVVELVNVVLGE